MQDLNYANPIQLAFFEFSTGAPHPLSTTHTVSLPPLPESHRASVNVEILGDHVLIPIWNYGNCSTVVLLVSWKTGTITLVGNSSKFCLALSLREPLQLRNLVPERPRTFDNRRPTMVVSINSSLISLIDNAENGLEICKLVLDPSPQLQTLCILELPPLASGASQFFAGADKEWVPTSKPYARTGSSRGYRLPFYCSAIGTIALRFDYHLKSKPAYSYMLLINVAALVSVIPTTVCNVPWEDWGPSTTHLYKLTTLRPTSFGPFWITNDQSPIVRQYDLQRSRHIRSVAGDKSSLQSRPPVIDSVSVFQYDIKTHLPYRDVVTQNKDLYESTYILADREWAVGAKVLVRRFFVLMVGIF